MAASCGADRDATILSWQPRLKMGVLSLSQQLFEVEMGMVKKQCWGRYVPLVDWTGTVACGLSMARAQPFMQLAERVGRVHLVVPPQEDTSRSCGFRGNNTLTQRESLVGQKLVGVHGDFGCNGESQVDLLSLISHNDGSNLDLWYVGQLMMEQTNI